MSTSQAFEVSVIAGGINPMNIRSLNGNFHDHEAHASVAVGVEMACKECGNTEAGTINGLCSRCTYKQYGTLFPWLEDVKKKTSEEESMSQMMVSARSENTGLALNCPHCKFTCRHDVSHVEDCIKLKEPLVCVACGQSFFVMTVKATGSGDDGLPTELKCGKCFSPRTRNGQILEACQNCGDGEIDLAKDVRVHER